MNAAARLISSSSRFDNITPLLRQLHWLKTSERIASSVKCIHGSAPLYLVDELYQVADVETRQRLRSASSSSLIVGRTRLSTVEIRAFPVAATGTIYLSTSLMHLRCLPSFRPRLKNHLLFPIPVPYRRIINMSRVAAF